MLELGNGEVEDEAELAEEGGGTAEAFLDLLVGAASGVDAGAEANGAGVQERG